MLFEEQISRKPQSDLFYTIYKTTNRINNKFYIGAHKTKNPHDSYLGSGILISKAIQKYGKDNFEKIILYECDSEFHMYEVESQLVTQSLIDDSQCYNLKLGGLNYLHMAESIRVKISQNNKGKRLGFKWLTNGADHVSISNSDKIDELLELGWVFGMADSVGQKISNKMLGKQKTDEHKLKIVPNLKKGQGWNKGLKTGPLPQSHRDNISKGNSGKSLSDIHKENVGIANAGRKWVTNGILERFLKNDNPELQVLLSNGWYFGKSIESKKNINKRKYK